MANSVQHNISALNANRNFGITKGILKSSTEKLSSGYKINRAADDAAGLSISEKMRRQIRGLTQASANAQDGISSVQTAEGALTEVHSMLQRMDELATKAANGSQSESDRQYVQDELDQLMTEIDRVAETTKFNETYLLKGNASKTESEKTVNAHDAGLAGTITNNGTTATFKLDKALEVGDSVKIAGKDYTIVDQSGSKNGLNTSTDGYKKIGEGNLSVGTTLKEGDSVKYKGNEYTLTYNVSISELKNSEWKAGDTFTVGTNSYSVVADNTASPTDSQIKIKDVNDKISAAVAAGEDVIVTKHDTLKLGSGSTSKEDARVVEEHNSGEISYVDLGYRASADRSTYSAIGAASSATVAQVAAAGSGETTDPSDLTVGDSVTKDGDKTIATENTPRSARDLANDINKLDTDGTHTVTVGVGDAAKKYVVSEKSDEANGKLTKHDILSKIKNMDTVVIDGDAAKTYTSIGATSLEELSDKLTTKEAYAMMADEIQKASSIGADTEANVINHDNGAFSITKGKVTVKDSLAFSLHVGADADMTNKISVNIDSMDTKGLGIHGLKVTGNSVANATYAIDAIEDAIQKVSTQRSALGAAQNRLEHTIKNLDNIVENTTAAEQEIRDTDMATEMVKFSNANILAQAGQSMLAQANQGNQGILSLLG